MMMMMMMMMIFPAMKQTIYMDIWQQSMFTTCIDCIV